MSPLKFTKLIMKKTILSFFLLSIITISIQVVLTSSSNGRAFSANSGNTGAPGENTTCRNCHGTGFGTTVSVAVKDGRGFPVTSYIPGAIYTVDFTVNATGASRYGFQLVSLNSSNNPVNGFTMPSSNTRLVTLTNGRQYAEHAGKSLTNSFSVQWTAPASGTGNVTFYGGGAAVNNNGGTSGDGGNTTNLVLPENTTVGLIEPSLRSQFLVYPNPTKNNIKLENTSKEMKETVARVYTITGQLVFDEQVNIAGSKTEKLNLSKLNSGTYILKVYTKTDSFEQKVIIK